MRWSGESRRSRPDSVVPRSRNALESRYRGTLCEGGEAYITGVSPALSFAILSFYAPARPLLPPPPQVPRFYATSMSNRPTPPPLPLFETYEEFIPWILMTDKAKNGVVKGPPGSVFCFRRLFYTFVLPLLLQKLGLDKVPGGKGVHQTFVSKMASEIWNHLPQDRVDFWTQVARDVLVYHEFRYPWFHTEEAKAKRAEERRLKRAKKSKSPKRSGPGPQRSGRAAARTSPYPSQRAQALRSSDIHSSAPFPVAGPSTFVDAAYPTSSLAHPPAIHPLYVPPPPPSMAASFPVPPSLHPPSMVPFYAPLSSSSSLVPPGPQSWSLPQQNALHFPAPSLPFPLTSSTSTATFPSAFPSQTQYQAPPFGYPSFPSLPNPQALSDAPDFPFELFEDGPLHSGPLPVANPLASPTTWFGIDPSDPLLQLPDHP